MAEIQKTAVFSDIAGTPKKALVDSQRRVVIVNSGEGQDATIYPGSTGAIAQNIETQIVAVTVGIGLTFYLTGWQGTGPIDAEFKLYKNAVRLMTRRNSASSRDVGDNFTLSPIKIDAGDMVKVTVKHTKGSTYNFDGCLIGYEV